MVDVYQLESKDGVRCTWQNWPSDRITSEQNVIPVSLLYTPLKQIQNIALVEYEPVRCATCTSILNPLSKVDYISKSWLCMFCSSRNRLPASYAAHISETNLPAELMSQFSTIEYILPLANMNLPPIFLFVVDTSGYEEELTSLKASLKQSLNLLPADALVGFITYGMNAFVYDLSSSDYTRCYSFKGDKSYTLDNIKEQLGLSSAVSYNAANIQRISKRFFMPASECEFILNSIIDELTKDPWPVPTDSRPYRCIGNALFIAESLLEITYPRQGARVLVFAGGAASYGPGMIVSDKLVDSIRTHHDVKNNNAKYIKSAVIYK